MIINVKLNNYLVGAANLLTISPYLTGDNARSDAEALRSDWEQVGKDIQTAITKYGQSSQAQKSTSQKPI